MYYITAWVRSKLAAAASGGGESWWERESGDECIEWEWSRDMARWCWRKEIKSSRNHKKKASLVNMEQCGAQVKSFCYKYTEMPTLNPNASCWVRW